MPNSLPKFADLDTATRLFADQGQEFAVVSNLAHVYPPYDLYPLAPARKKLDSGLRAAVMDMDGTTTTTEPLCINALETMVGRVSGKANDADWAGLDPELDYPHIIGNSSTRHVEYLLQTYGHTIQPKCFMESVVHAAAWTIGFSQDASRRQDLESMLLILGIDGLKSDPRFQALTKIARHDGKEEQTVIATLASELADAYPQNDFPRLTRAAVEIYYQRYHELLSAVSAAGGAPLPAHLRAPSDGLLIQPMPGIGIYLALIGGLLGSEATTVLPILLEHLKDAGLSDTVEAREAEERLAALGTAFAAKPAQVALVTSSIAYEADVVLGEVFRQLHEGVSNWGISEGATERLRKRFVSPHAFYDAIITASDSCEMRLKPHRDLYSLALGRLGLHPDEFVNVAGFEDSESGTIAIRAAGISVCCALPFHMTTGHTFHAASHTCSGGLPQVILEKNCFLPE
jgi:beta-phosphoglucomutase-like phosphatase (HAD superfamily)